MVVGVGKLAIPLIPISGWAIHCLITSRRNLKREEDHKGKK